MKDLELILCNDKLVKYCEVQWTKENSYNKPLKMSIMKNKCY